MPSIINTGYVVDNYLIDELLFFIEVCPVDKLLPLANEIKLM